MAARSAAKDACVNVVSHPIPLLLYGGVDMTELDTVGLPWHNLVA
jgi:hypothetical protein